jgi:hypothetical protein
MLKKLVQKINWKVSTRWRVSGFYRTWRSLIFNYLKTRESILNPSFEKYWLMLILQVTDWFKRPLWSWSTSACDISKPKTCRQICPCKHFTDQRLLEGWNNAFDQSTTICMCLTPALSELLGRKWNLVSRLSQDGWTSKIVHVYIQSPRDSPRLLDGYALDSIPWSVSWSEVTRILHRSS